MKNISLSILFLCSFLSNMIAQNEEIETQQINIVKDFNVFVEDAQKISNTIDYNPKFDERVENENLKYELPERIESFKFEPGAIRPIGYSKTDTLIKNLSFLKIGFGSLLNPLVEWNHNINNDNESMNIYLKHNSAWIEPEVFQRYSNSDLKLSAQKKINKFDIKPYVEFQNKYYNFFGNLNESLDKNKADRFFNLGKIGTIAELNQNGIKKISHRSEISLLYALENLNQKEEKKNNEYQYALSHKATYKYSENFTPSILGYAQIAQTNFNVQTHRQIIGINPELSYKTKSLNLIAGIDLAHTSINGNSSIFALPKVETEVQIVPKFVTLYSIWSRTLQNNLFSEWIQFNPFIQMDAQLLPISKIEKRSAGFKGNYKNFSYNASLTQKIIKDAILFANDSINPRFFNMEIERNMTVNDLSLEMFYVSNSPLSFSFKSNLYFYELDNLKMAYNLPSIISNFGIYYKLKPNWIIHSEIIGISGVKSKIGNTEVTTPFQIDLNLSTEYGIKKNIFIFGMFNNLLNTKINQFVGYNSFGINAQAGVRILY